MIRSVLTLALALVAGPALAVTAGTAAPDFSVADSNGKTVKLSDYKGKFVVLEWTNPECPFVRAQYERGRHAGAAEGGRCRRQVVWLTVNSTNKSSDEYKSGAQMNAWMKEKGAAQSAILIDATSETGRAYDAKTTPHMFVIDPAGKDRVRGRHRRQAQRARVRPQDREQLRARSAR
jgi:hypothetical protein